MDGALTWPGVVASSKSPRETTMPRMRAPEPSAWSRLNASISALW